ncbi:hypothetical protein JXL21_00325 [Candidatus Bathyarchaeota archaeon]|nr:hypothetical protein [Candidatus Bathyarchaeota archaeon]
MGLAGHVLPGPPVWLLDRLFEASFLMDWHGALDMFRFFPSYVIGYGEIDAFMEARGRL